jgi:hypothetical protein
MGAFRLTIPVTTEGPVLRSAIRNLAALRYIAQAIPVTNHWHPIFERYSAQIGAKVKGLGVDPASVVAFHATEIRTSGQRTAGSVTSARSQR